MLSVGSLPDLDEAAFESEACASDELALQPHPADSLRDRERMRARAPPFETPRAPPRHHAIASPWLPATSVSRCAPRHVSGMWSAIAQSCAKARTRSSTVHADAQRRTDCNKVAAIALDLERAQNAGRAATMRGHREGGSQRDKRQLRKKQTRVQLVTRSCGGSPIRRNKTESHGMLRAAPRMLIMAKSDNDDLMRVETIVTMDRDKSGHKSNPAAL